MLPPGPQLPAHQLREVSVRAECDPRSFRKFLRGEDVRPMVQQRIRRALHALGLAPVQVGRQDGTA